MLDGRRKGISPVIATVLLIGVAVFAAGGIFTFTQGKMSTLTQEPAPAAFFKVTAQDCSSGFCDEGGNQYIWEHRKGDDVELEKVTFVIRNNRNDRVCELPTEEEFDDVTFETGEKLIISSAEDGGNPWGCADVSVKLSNKIGGDHADHCNCMGNDRTLLNPRSGDELEMTVRYRDAVVSERTVTYY